MGRWNQVSKACITWVNWSASQWSVDVFFVDEMSQTNKKKASVLHKALSTYLWPKHCKLLPHVELLFSDNITPRICANNNHSHWAPCLDCCCEDYSKYSTLFHPFSGSLWLNHLHYLSSIVFFFPSFLNSYLLWTSTEAVSVFLRGQDANRVKRNKWW